MKNQYYGDINDYRKYGLLRVIKQQSRARLFVNWMLTPDDTGPDGKFIRYLSDHERFRSYDPDLFDVLKSHVDGGIREVSLIESAGLLSAEGFHSVLVPDDKRERAEWFELFRTKSKGCELVFFDPDNGLEVPTVPYGKKKSSKYVYWHELEATWNRGSSVLFYQHFRRVKRSAFTEQLIKEVGSRTPRGTIGSFETSNIVFLIAIQPGHESLIPLRTIIENVRNNWNPELRVELL